MERWSEYWGGEVRKRWSCARLLCYAISVPKNKPKISVLSSGSQESSAKSLARGDTKHTRSMGNGIPAGEAQHEVAAADLAIRSPDSGSNESDETAQVCDQGVDDHAKCESTEMEPDP